MENGLSWLSLGNSNVVTPRNTIISSDYNDLTNKPIITLNGTNQNPIKLWTLEMGVYILNGYIQHSNELMSEGKGLFVTIAAMMVNGKYVVSAYIPFWEGLYEYILPSSSSEAYTQHQIINMVSQENTLTLDNEKIYTPMENYHPSTKKYADDMFTILRNELSNIGINRDNIEDLKQVNRRRDIIIQALLSQNSDKTVTIEEEKHNISLDLAIDRGMTTINELEGSTLVNVSKQKESIPLSCKADTVENTNVANLTENGVIRPIIQGNTLVNNNIQWDDKVVIGNQIEQMSGVEVNIEDCNGEIDVALEGHTGVNLSNRKGGLLSTTFDSQSGNYITLNPSEDCGTTLGIEGNTMVNYCNNGNISMGLNKEINVVDDTGKMITLDDTVDSGLVDVKVEGKTLVNLANTHMVIGTGSNTKYTFDGEYYSIQKTNGYTLGISFKSRNDLLEVNKTYTIIINNKSEMQTFLYDINYSKISNLSDGINIIKFTPSISQLIRVGDVSSTISEGLIKFAIVLLEGDHTDKDISYFEGLKSVGQDTDEISVSSANINLLDEKYYSNIPLDKNTTIDNNGLITIGVNDGTGGLLVNKYPHNTTNLKPNSTMRFHAIFPKENRTLNGVGLFVYDGVSGKTINSNTHVKTNRYVEFTVPSHGKVRLCVSCIYKDNSIGSFYLMLTGNTVGVQDNYIPHQSNKKQILYYNPNTQTWEKPILREWDSIEKHSDGKYYYHKRSGEVVLNGSESGWYKSMEGQDINSSCFQIEIIGKKHGYGVSMCDRFTNTCNSEPFAPTGVKEFTYTDHPSLDTIYMNYGKGNSTSTAEWKTWLQANPTTVVYQLAQEEVYECTNLSLDTYSNQTNIFNNSLIPCNMEIKNSTYDCILFPNTKYTVKLDSNISNDIQVNLGGTNTVVNTNIFEITTPNELTNESLTLYGNGEVINNAMIFTDSKENVFTDGYVDGLKSSFEDQYIPTSIWNIDDVYIHGDTNSNSTIVNVDIEDRLQAGKTYTLLYNIDDSTTCEIGVAFRLIYNDNTSAYLEIEEGNLVSRKGQRCKLVSIPSNLKLSHFEFWNRNKGIISISNIAILEGDYTSNPPTYEEVVNHSGKYKVEHKVTGKNLFDIRKMSVGNNTLIKGDNIIMTPNDIFTTGASYQEKCKLKRGITYTINSNVSPNTSQAYFEIKLKDINYNFLEDYIRSYGLPVTFTIPDNAYYIEYIVSNGYGLESEIVVSNIQVEEGSTVTKYEPYKESIKTLYLNSPLLEGDKIVTYKGNVCHYHKMGKVVLDGSEAGAWMSVDSNHNGISFCYNSSVLSNTSNSKEVGLGYGKLFCDKLKYIIQDGTKTINQHSLTGYNQIARNSSKQYSNYIYISTTCSDARSFRQWLAENPVTVIYELTNPYYEIIESNADTSIELFSNVSYLSVDTSVPINFVEFKPYTDELTYLENNTQYRVTFNCNVEGKPISISLGGTEIEDITKLENSVLITTPNELVDEKLIIDGKGIVNIDNVRVTKGDMMYNKYFEGMKSSFEMEDTVKTIIKYCPIEFGKGGRIE